MNFRATAIRFIQRHIPTDVLKRAFLPASQRQGFSLNYTNESLESIIEREVIMEQFIPDLNNLTGQETEIELDPSWMSIADNNTMIFRIPKSATNGKSITHVHSYRMGSIRHGSTNYSYGLGYNVGGVMNGYGGGDLLAGSVAALASQSSVANVEQDQVELLDDNVVHVKMISRGAIYATLRCTLENDVDLRHIKAPYYPKIAMILVELTKGIIYSRLQLEQEQGFIKAGHQLGEFKTVVDSYADALTNYQEMLDEKIISLFILGDADKKKDHISLLVSSY